MHPEFGTWYRLVESAPTNDKLVQRWKIIEAIANDDDGDIDDNLLLRIACLPGTSDHHRSAIFVKPFQDADASFDPRGLVEHAVLARSVLSVRMQSDDDDLQDAVATALAVAASACAGARKGEIWSRTGLAAEAVEAVQQLSANRWPPEKDVIGIPATESYVTELQALTNQNPVPPAVVQATATSLKALGGALSRTHGLLHQAMLRQRLLAEECNMLWWLMCGVSQLRKLSYSKLPIAEATVAAGMELAQLTRVPPGPCSVASFLEKMLSSTKDYGKALSIADAIDGCSMEWRRGIAAPLKLDSVDFAVPLHVALQESSKSRTWGEAFTSRTGIAPEFSMPPQELAMQVFLEAALLRARANDDEG